MDAVQLKVISALAQGTSVSDAARLAGVHRATVYNRQQQPAFAAALRKAHNDLAASMRAEFSALGQLALDKIRHILEKDDTPPGVRLRAALAVIKHTAAPEPRPVEEIVASLRSDMADQQAECDAVSALAGDVPRGAPCPCGSGVKYKRCCGVAAPPKLGANATTQ